MQKTHILTGSPWEDTIGYARAVKIGNTIEVSGTTATVDGKVVGIGNVYEQTKCALSIIENALKEAGASMNDVVRTRMYVTDISQWEEVGRAHGEYFKDIKPATAMVEVSALIDKDHLVEIEAVAVTS